MLLRCAHNLRILSICLGRPMAVEDTDCNCEFPLDMDDSELETFGKRNTHDSLLQGSISLPPSSRLTGFLSFLRLCKISGKIDRSVNSIQIQQSCKGPKKAAEFKRLVDALDTELEK